MILFVHGAGGNHQHWTYQLERLGENHLAIALDLPGHGQSQGNAAPDIADYTEFIKLFAEHLIGCPFILAGHSMGGAIAMDFAFKYPQNLLGLVLAGTGARLKVLPAILNTFASGKLFRQLIDMAYGKDAPRKLLEFARSQMEMVSPAVFFNDFTACNKFDIRDNLPDIQVQSLVIAAEDDVLTPVKYGENLHDRLPRSNFKVIKRAGHMMMLEKPDDFNEILEQFIAAL